MARRNKIYLGTNTKMYKTIEETQCFLTELSRLTADISREQLELFVIPSFTALESARKCVRAESVTLGAQNMGWEDEGQFTGEISPLMLKEVGAQIALIGHSERRHMLGETDGQENKKVLCALRHGLTPLLCVGETGAQKRAGTADEALRIQLKEGLLGAAPEQARRLWVAYEPVWAIGVNGVPAAKEYAEEKHEVIKQTLNGLFGEEIGGEIPVLYGGSVNRENAAELIQMPHVDGLFIGRSAWDARELNAIIRAAMPLFFTK